MVEAEDYELKPEYLHGKIESLQFLVELVVATMPPEHRAFISRRMGEYARKTEELAARHDTDHGRLTVSAAYDTKDYFDANADIEADAFSSAVSGL